MKSMLDAATRQEITARINSLQEGHQARWGKMNVFQMVKHCTLCEDMFLGNIKIKRVLIGRLIGPFILRQVLKDEKPIKKNSPTAPVLMTVGDNGELEQQKRDWISRIASYEDHPDTHFIHPFFGPMTPDQTGRLAYKHSDHHLRQFGA